MAQEGVQVLEGDEEKTNLMSARQTLTKFWTWWIGESYDALYRPRWIAWWFLSVIVIGPLAGFFSIVRFLNLRRMGRRVEQQHLHKLAFQQSEKRAMAEDQRVVAQGTAELPAAAEQEGVTLHDSEPEPRS